MGIPDLPPYGLAVRRYDPDRFFTALFAPSERRDVLLLLYAFNHELARAREIVSEPMLALIRLQWWREVVEGEPRRHELATPLAVALDEGRLAREDLLQMIEGREMETEPSIATLEDWRSYLELSAGALAVAAGRALGAGEADLVRLRAVGAAYGAAGLLRSVTVRAREGRCLLPQDALGASGVISLDALADPMRVRQVSTTLAAEARSWLRQGCGFYAASVRAAALVGVYARRDLRRIGRARDRPPGFGRRAAVFLAVVTGRV